MSANWQSPGPNFVPAYQLSGTPYVITLTNVDTTVNEITFPSATRWIIVSMTDAADLKLRIGFTANGVNANPSGNPNFYLLQGTTTGDSEFYNQTPRLELRCKSLFIRTDTGTCDNVSILAGLSTVSAEQFPVLTGTLNQTGSDGTIFAPARPKFKGVG